MLKRARSSEADALLSIKLWRRIKAKAIERAVGIR